MNHIRLVPRLHCLNKSWGVQPRNEAKLYGMSLLLLLLLHVLLLERSFKHEADKGIVRQIHVIKR